MIAINVSVSVFVNLIFGQIWSRHHEVNDPSNGVASIDGTVYTTYMLLGQSFVMLYAFPVIIKLSVSVQLYVGKKIQKDISLISASAKLSSYLMKKWQ